MLLTNGDSFTYGDELPGSRPEKGETATHQHLTYTHHLASHLGCNYVNLSQNGSSNMKIYRTTMDFLQKTSKKIDYLVILWSTWGRSELCESFTIPENEGMYIGRETDMNQLIPSHKSTSFIYLDRDLPEGYDERNRIIKEWKEKVYTMETAIVHSLTYMKNIQYVCDLMGIKVFQGVIHGGMWKNVMFTFEDAEKNQQYEEYRNFVRFSLTYLRNECKIGLGVGRSITQFCEDEGYRILGGGHPDHLGHQAYADYLHDIIKGA